jgi:hypothetical protein
MSKSPNRFTRLKPGLLADFIPAYLADKGPTKLADLADAVERRVGRRVANITLQTALQTLRSNGSIAQLRHGVYAAGDMAGATMLERLTAGNRAHEAVAAFFFVKDDPFTHRNQLDAHLRRELPGLPPTEPDLIVRQLIKMGVLFQRPYNHFAKDLHKDGKGVGLTAEVWADLVQARADEERAQMADLLS